MTALRRRPCGSPLTLRRLAHAALLCLCSLLAAAVAAPVRASDLADEADLRFQLGADAYQRGDYQAALQHFLVSNRLVPNKNVLFNIARVYEKLDRYPEAHRYYTQALDQETDPAAQARIRAALEQIRPNVAVLNIRSTPPGATLYIDRRDLGPRGSAPRELGLAPGSYEVIAELPGHHPAAVRVGPLGRGQSAEVLLELRPILGKVRVRGPATDGFVRVGDAEATPSCRVPCELELPPGEHRLFIEKAGHRTAEVSVRVRADQTRELRPRLDVLTGTLVVSTDEPGALVQIDGRSVGFTPSIVPLPVGDHHLRVSAQGFREEDRAIRVEADRQTRVDLELALAEEVTAASRVTETVAEAPSSVSIIPRKELRALAYPTLVEALRGVRGVYVWDDRSYATAGIRGLGRLGSYGNRLLVLVDGHPLNDNWIGSSYIGYDARTDLADLERVEVVRGPGSVLYGTNAFAGVVNLVSRYREVPEGAEFGLAAYGDGVARARARADLALGDGAGLWTSVAAARGQGREFFFPEFAADSPPPIAGHARGLDGFEAGTVQGRLFWKWLTLQWLGHVHEKQLPTAAFETLFADPRTRQTDRRAFIEARAEPELTETVQLMSRLHLNYYAFRGRYPREPADGGLELDTFDGAWFGLEERVVFRPSERFRITVGGEGQLHFEVEQTARDDSGFFLDDQRDYQIGAAYGLLDVDLSERLRFSGGARVDAYSTFGAAINPRAAFIAELYPGGVSKVLAGKAFRAPSIYELFYNDDGFTQRASPDLEPEQIYSLEVEHTHRFVPTLSGTASLFGNYVQNLIDIRGSGTQSDLLHYVNSSSPLLTVGGELELRRDWRQGFMLAASYSYQRSEYLADESLESLARLRFLPTARRVANAPEHLAAVKGAVPIVGRAATLGSRLTFEGPCYDRFEDDDDSEAQRRTDPFVIWDLVVSGEEDRWGLGWAIGAYNLFDWRVALPVSGEFRQRGIPQSGRTFLASLELTL